MFKLVEKGLSLEEFISKKEEIESNLDGESYWGQKENERVVDDIRCAICYTENDETTELWYTENYDETGKVTYDIYVERNEVMKIRVSSWFDWFKIRDLEKEEFNKYNVTTTDIEENFDNLEDAINFYNSIEEVIMSNKYDVYVRSKIMYYVNEDGERINDINIFEDYDNGLYDFVERNIKNGKRQ